MNNFPVPESAGAEESQISPDYVRISMAAAIELRLKPGRLMRDCGCGCINLLQHYPEGCYANCSYCGLARERPGEAQDNTFIRVAWPLYPTDLVAERIAEREAASPVGRVCIAQVQDPRAYDDLVEMTRRVRRVAKEVPISALVSATTLDEERLYHVKEAGADIIGVGLDAASEGVFYETRGKGARGPHKWDHHWRIIEAARKIYGPMKVNCHVVVGLGETDRELVNLFFQCQLEQIAVYLFSFNPEPGTVMQDIPRAPIQRWRRIQLVKYLMETSNLRREEIEFDTDGNLCRVHSGAINLDAAIESGVPFMTNGCPARDGKVACNRPYGSYRPGEEFRDYPFLPNREDLIQIRQQTRVQEIEPQLAPVAG